MGTEEETKYNAAILLSICFIMYIIGIFFYLCFHLKIQNTRSEGPPDYNELFFKEKPPRYKDLFFNNKNSSIY